MSLFIQSEAAQAIQEDEAQLLSAGAQLMHQLSALIKSAQPSRPPLSADKLRIQMGRRLIYGQLPDGRFHNELDATKLRVILTVIQKPAVLGRVPDENALPALEIRERETLIFRQEMDGTVTVNQLQPQVAQAKTASPSSAQADPDNRTEQLEQTVRQFLQQVAKTQVWDKATGAYRLELGPGHDLCITDKHQGRGIVFQRWHGKVFSKLTAADFAYFERLADKLHTHQPKSQQQQFSIKKKDLELD